MSIWPGFDSTRIGPDSTKFGSEYHKVFPDLATDWAISAKCSTRSAAFGTPLTKSGRVRQSRRTIVVTFCPGLVKAGRSGRNVVRIRPTPPRIHPRLAQIRSIRATLARTEVRPTFGLISATCGQDLTRCQLDLARFASTVGRLRPTLREFSQM